MADLSAPRDELLQQIRALKTQRKRLRARLKRSRAEQEGLSALNEELTRQQARAVSAGSIPDETGMRYLFVVTYGRSGSTLLQGLLTSIPGYLVRGENGGAAYQLFELHRQLAALRDKHGHAPFATSPWYGIGGYADEIAYASIRQFMLATLIRPEPDSRVVGFKEIRWPDETLSEYVEFLRQVFPGARFVVNTRDHSQVTQSKWWTRQPDAAQALAEAEGRLMSLEESLGEDFFHVHYNDYVDDSGRLRPLFEWLGEPFDEATVKAVMAVRHSY
jgi:hypothetical protein